MLRRATLLTALLCALVNAGCRDDNLPPPGGMIYPPDAMDSGAVDAASPEGGPG